MMLAYRRGLLEPDYKFGLQSMIREKLILEMLDKEQAAEALLTAVKLSYSGLAPAVKPEAAIEFVNSYENVLRKVAYLREYRDDAQAITRAAETSLLSEARNMVKAFNMLKERGIIEEFRKAAEKAAKESQEEF